MKGCKYQIKTEGKDRILKIDCRGCFSGMSIEDSDYCMEGVVKIACKEPNFDSIILSEVVEREYDNSQTKIILTFAAIYEETRTWPFANIVKNNCEKCKGEREALLRRILEEYLPRNPVFAYFHLLNCIRTEEYKKESAESPECVECRHCYIENLDRVKRVFELYSVIRESRETGEIDSEGRRIYRRLFSPLIRPFFSTSKIILEPPPGSTLISTYQVGDAIVRIYLLRGKPEYVYFISPSEYNLSSEEFEIINKTREAMIKHRPEAMDFSGPEKAREYFKRLARRTISEIFLETGKDVSRDKIERLSDILSKYTVGLGIIEVLLCDPNVQDVYINAPSREFPLCIAHAQVEDCITNVYLTEDDIECMISRFRARSGRTFSEADPTLDLELLEFGTRVAAIGKPISPDGTAFALRRQKSTPWTLPQFIENGTVTAQAAGLLSFLIDGQVTMLFTGSRGSGKTSLLTSMIGELMPKLRILTIEDTLEIPVLQLNAVGYRIQRLKIQSAVGKSETELTPQEALATALRLGESVLIIGEVRGPETKVLYESMRIGAAGNAVLGTIHGASTQSVFERVVYDIGVPANSFKSTDIVVASAPIRRGGGLKRCRRVLQISEVSKDWYSNNPDPKEVFSDLMVYNPSKDCLEATDEYKNSNIIKTIARKWNLTYEQAIGNIELRAKIRQQIVNFSKQFEFPEILEIAHVVNANNKFRTLNEEQLSSGKLDYEKLYEDWKEWFWNYVGEVKNARGNEDMV